MAATDWHARQRWAPLALLILGVAQPGLAWQQGQGGSSEPSACAAALPAAIKVDRQRIEFPVPGGAESLSVVIRGPALAKAPATMAGGWGRTVGDRGQIATVVLAKRLADGAEYSMATSLFRPLVEREGKELGDSARRLLAKGHWKVDSSGRLTGRTEVLFGMLPWLGCANAAGPLPSGISAAAWDSSTRSVALTRDSLRVVADSLTRLLDHLESSEPFARLRERVAAPRGASRRELTRLDQLLALNPRDTAPERLASMRKLAISVQEMLAGWQARWFDSVPPSLVHLRAARVVIDTLIDRTDRFVSLHARLASVEGRSELATSQLATAIAAKIAGANAFVFTYQGSITTPPVDRGKVNLAAGTHYVATWLEGDDNLSAQGLRPSALVHFGTDLSLDLGLALGSFRRDRGTTDLVWRTNFVVGAGYRIKDGIRAGAGLELVPRRSPATQLGAYVGLSLDLLKL